MKYSKNKAAIINTLVVLFVITFIIFAIWGTSKIDPIYCLVGLGFLEIFMFIPAYNFYFYKLFNSDMKWRKIANFIPIYNYTIALPSICSILCFALLGILFLLVLTLTVFPSVSSMIFSENTVYGLGEKLPIVIFLLVSVFNIIVGVGMSIQNKSIDLYSDAALGDRGSSKRGFLVKIITTVNFLNVFLLCIPLARILVISLEVDKLKSLDDLNLNCDNIRLSEQYEEEE